MNTGASGANISNSGTVTSLGYNLSSDHGGGVLTGPGDQINTNPLLGPLQNNGGRTFTHELLSGSPAITAGDPSFTPPPFNDQRGPGFNRVVNGRIDVGSFEVQPHGPVVSNTNDSGPGSLRQALADGVHQGLFGLATAAGVQAWSAHRRLRMVDPHGSGSSACASTRVPEDLLGPASRFIEGVGWHGMFMFEVLRDADGIPWFIEFNGRAWGSMALARRIGFEYPAWTVQAALDPHRRIDAPPIREGVVCRHLGMDLRHAFVVFRGPSSRAVEWPSRWQTLRDVLTFRRGQTWYNARRGCRIVFVEDTALAVLDLGGRVAKRLRDVTSRRRRRSTSTRVAPRSAVVTPAATGMPDPVEMLAFLWSGQEGLFELARKDGLVYERQLYTRDAALASLAGNDVFGPVARVPRDSAQVVEEGNVLWADIDEADGLDERLATRVSVAPSVLLDSGNRGFWAFWKLNRPIPAAELESLNRGLAHQLGGDVGSVQRTQLARLPGSRRKETGRVAKVVAFAPVSYDPQQLAAVRETRIGRRLRAAVARLR